MKYIGTRNKDFFEQYPYLHRYLPLDRALDMFNSNRFSLNKPENWNDPFEIFYLKKKFKIGANLHDLPMKNCVLACCFTTTRSEASWKIYTPNNDGVRITFDTKKLLNGLVTLNKNLNFCIGPVNYHNTKDFYSMAKESSILAKEIKSKKIGNTQIELLMRKRAAFEYEKEIRLLLIGQSLNFSAVNIELQKCVLELQLHPLMGKSQAAIFKNYFKENYNIRTTQSELYKEISDSPIILKVK